MYVCIAVESVLTEDIAGAESFAVRPWADAESPTPAVADGEGGCGSDLTT